MEKHPALSQLANGTTVPKSDLRMHAVGNVDELCSHIGLLCAQIDVEFRPPLHDIQRHLFTIGAVVSQAPHAKSFNEADAVEALRKQSSAWLQAAGGFRGFILPGGCLAAAQAHVCRAVCRRAERSVVALSTDHYGIAYLNALSTYFFALAAWLNVIYKVESIKL